MPLSPGSRCTGKGASMVWSCACSLAAEQIALHEFLNETSHAVVAGGTSRHDALDFCAIAETHACAGGVDRQIVGEIARDLGSIGELAGGVDRLGVVEGKGPAVFADAGHRRH